MEEVEIMENELDQSAEEFSRHRSVQKLLEQLGSCIREYRNKQLRVDVEKLKRVQQSERHG